MRVLHHMHDFSDQLADDIRRAAESAFAREHEEKERVFGDAPLFEVRRARVRGHFINAIGGLDIGKTPLNARVTGTVAREKYEIRKVIFESRPMFHVTSSLYVPHGLNAPAPAILFLCGHGEHAKAHATYQRACIDLANNGFVVLAVDCVGQGERFQYIDAETGRMSVRWGTHEHSYAGLQFSLAGMSIAQVFVWDGIRALDYLTSLDYVDGSRVGVTGASGGGTQSSYMMMADQRIAAAAPCNYLTSREEYMKTGQAHDSEQNMFQAIESGLNNDDFVLSFAPRPLLIGSVESDFFCVEGVEKTYARGKRAYALFGRPDAISLYTAKGTHALNDELRQAVVDFFRKTFLGENEPFVTDPKMRIEEPETLWCLERGQVLRDIKGERTVTDIVRERVQTISRPPLTRDALAAFLNIPPECSRVPLRPRFMPLENGAVPLFFFTQPNVAVCGALHKQKKTQGALTIHFTDTGTQGKHGGALRYHLERGDVLIADVRGFGACRSRDVNIEGYEQIYGTLYKLNCDAIMLGTSLMAMQAFDAVRFVELARLMGYTEITLSGTGYGALLALIAAVITGVRADVENSPPAFHELAVSRYYRYHPLHEVFGVLRVFDIPDLLALLGPRATVRETPDPGPYMD